MLILSRPCCHSATSNLENGNLKLCRHKRKSCSTNRSSITSPITMRRLSVIVKRLAKLIHLMWRLGIITHKRMKKLHCISRDSTVMTTRREFKGLLASRKTSFCIVSLAISTYQSWQSSLLRFCTSSTYFLVWPDWLNNLNLALSLIVLRRRGQSHCRPHFDYWKFGSNTATWMRFKANWKKVSRELIWKFGLKLSHSCSPESTSRTIQLEGR